MSSAGVIRVDTVFYKIDAGHAFNQVLVVSDGDQPGDAIIIIDFHGEIIAEHARPTPGIGTIANEPGTAAPRRSDVAVHGRLLP